MATTRPPPQFTTFFTKKENVDKIRCDVALLSYLLAQVSKYDNEHSSGQTPSSRSKLESIQPWVHLASILTAGDSNDPFGNKDVAVTGKVENDAITAALVARNVSLSHPSHQPPVTKLTLDAMAGWKLLTTRSAITIDVSFSQHATDVFSILQYLFSPSQSDGDPKIYSFTRVRRFAMFISRRCYRRLQARVGQGARMWSRHPLELIHAWYTSQTTSVAATSTTPGLASKQFNLSSTNQIILATFGLHPDEHHSPSSSTAQKLSYTVSQDTAHLWTTMLCKFLETMAQLYTSAPWTSEEWTILWQTIAAFRDTLKAGILDYLITPDLAQHLGAERQHGLHRPRLQEAILHPAPNTSPVHSAVASEMYGQGASAVSDHGANDNVIDNDNKESNGNEDHEGNGDTEDTEYDNGDTEYDNEDTEFDNEFDDQHNVHGKEHGKKDGIHGVAKRTVLRYLRTLCIAVDAAKFYESYAQRLAKPNMQLQAYVLSSEPSIPAIAPATVRSFANKFLKHFSPSLPPLAARNIGAAFETLAQRMQRRPFDAVEHAEAIVMALACKSAGTGGGSAPGLERDSTTSTATSTTTITPTIRSIFEVTQVPVGVGKKCCFCCHKLATLLKQHAGLDFVLQGTHSTIYPWIPPKGIPLAVLTELRLMLLRILYDTVKEAVDILARSTQTSPASTVPSDSDDEFSILDDNDGFGVLPPPMSRAV